ncbi:MAG: metal-dependent hydrolase [archaeon]
MNTLFHFFFNYLVVSGAFGIPVAREEILIILAASTFIDIDHLAYIIRKRRLLAKFNRRLGPESHSELHELFGLTLFSAFFLAAYFLGWGLVAKISALCFVLHLAVDFASGKTRPLRPFSRELVYFLHLSIRKKVIFEILMTLAAGGAFLLLWLG